MNVWLAISLTLAVAAIYMLMIEVFSVAFKLTGLATKKIKLQVASLFTSTGFTTQESELITNDDRRRRIAVTCMYTGHIFSVVIMGLVINVVIQIINALDRNSGGSRTFTEWYFIVFYVSLFIFLLVLVIKIPGINKRFQRLLENIAISASKRNRHNNIITVLDFYGKNAICEVLLNKLPEFADGVSLFEMKLTKKYVINILSIKRGKRMVDVTKDTMFRKGDILVIYGYINDIKEAFINSVNGKKTIVVDKTNELQLLNNYGGNALMEVSVDEVPEELKDKKIKDSHLTDQYFINIVVIKRKDEYLFADKDTIIKKGDTITLFGPYKNIKLLFQQEEK